MIWADLRACRVDETLALDRRACMAVIRPLDPAAGGIKVRVDGLLLWKSELLLSVSVQWMLPLCGVFQRLTLVWIEPVNGYTSGKFSGYWPDNL